MKSGIENPLKSEVIGRCGGDEKNEWIRRNDKSRKLKNNLKMLVGVVVAGKYGTCILFYHLIFLNNK